MYVLKVLKNVLLKNESILANFMDSKLNHAIMLRSKLRNEFLKGRSNKDREAYKKQRNLVCCVRIKKITLKL